MTVLASASPTSVPRLEMRGISKAFGPVRVLDRISLTCRSGEVHALCGENGAGKSTLMKVLSGAYQADAGEILIDGQHLRFGHPAEARKAGVSIIHQELSLLPHRSVADNIFLGLERNRAGIIARRQMEVEAAQLLARLGSSIAPATLAGRLSIAEQQMVEIAKALAIEARILVLDEPTAPLDAAESARLFAVIADLRQRDVAIIYISHRMKEVFELANRITVLKDGACMASMDATAASPDDVICLMVGRHMEEFFPPRASKKGMEILRVEDGGNHDLSHIDLTLRAGEIVGVAGLEGSGKDALAKAIFGADPFTQGKVIWARDRMARSPRQGACSGIAYLPDDRKSAGLGLRQSLRDNAALTARSLTWALAPPWLRGRAQRDIDALLRRVEVRAADYDAAVERLSGGNQQKIVVARWLATKAWLWVVAEPTRGIDVGAKATIYRLLRDFTENGGAVLMISSDLAEVIGLSDRILVMADGRLVGELPAGASEEAVLAKALHHDRAGPAVLQ